MRLVPITYHGGPALPSEVAETVATHRTLGDVTAWLRTLVPPRLLDEIVTQDEYTHDVLFALAPDCWLVYDTT
jgi:hypothetical protein